MSDMSTTSTTEYAHDLFDEAPAIQSDVASHDAQRSIIIDENPIKSAIRYHFNCFGLPAALGFIAYYGHMIYQQIKVGVPEDFQIIASMEQLWALRYVGSFLYFVVAFLNPPFIFEQHNAEAPVLLSTFLQLHYESFQKPMNILAMVISAATLMACFLRRKPYWRCFLNAWTKDKSELKRPIALARQTAADL